LRDGDRERGGILAATLQQPWSTHLRTGSDDRIAQQAMVGLDPVLVLPAWLQVFPGIPELEMELRRVPHVGMGTEAERHQLDALEDRMRRVHERVAQDVRHRNCVDLPGTGAALGKPGEIGFAVVGRHRDLHVPRFYRDIRGRVAPCYLLVHAAT